MQVRKFSFAPLVAALAGVGAAVMPAVSFAALDAAVTTELATSKTDILTLGGIIFGIAVAIVLYKWLRKAL